MKCEGCGYSAAALKTVRWRTGERCFVLCDPCYSPLADSLWIVAGWVAVHGKCRVCGSWASIRELEDLRKGGKWDALSGLCTGCGGKM